jgi:RimJ/RimL family protein N-acetyltransferase
VDTESSPRSSAAASAAIAPSPPRPAPQAAEIAVTVIDDWQGRGLGTELVAQLSQRARSEGIRRFTALVAADNPAMARLLRNVRADLVHRERGAVQYEIMLGSEGTGE